MKKYMIILFLLICCISIILCSCTETEDKKTEKLCVKCGKTATTTLSGPSEILKKNGIDISQCKRITSSVYSAPVCDSCVGPVAEIKPDAGFSGETPFN